MNGPSPSSLQHELRQTRPFRSPGHEAAIALLRTAALVARQHARIVEPHGLSGEQYNVLRILRGAGEAGLPTLEIAARMVQPTPGITRLLDKLETKTLVLRRRCAEDRRQVLCFIAPRGLELLAGIDEPLDRHEAAAFAGLNPEELEQLLGLLEKVRRSLPAASKGENSNE